MVIRGVAVFADPQGAHAQVQWTSGSGRTCAPPPPDRHMDRWTCTWGPRRPLRTRRPGLIRTGTTANKTPLAH
eukprot:3957797-Alexandrium_andersonii.AAC.1